MNSNHSAEPDNYVHPSVEIGDRAARARRLGCVAGAPYKWVEDTAKGLSAEHSIAAIVLAAALLKTKRLEEGEAAVIRNNTAFVLTRAKTLAQPDGRRLAFASAECDQSTPPEWLVDETVAAHPGAHAALMDDFGIRAENPEAAFRALLSVQHERRDWARFWALSRAIPVSRAEQIIRETIEPEVINARTRDGTFQPVQHLLLRGEIVDEPSLVTGVALIDEEYHVEDMDLLRWIGASDRPRVVSAASGHRAGNILFPRYHQQMVDRFVVHSRKQYQKTPQGHLVDVPSKCIAPLDILLQLTGESAVRMSEAIFDLLPDMRRSGRKGNSSDEVIVLSHKTRPEDYGDLEVPSLIPWVLRRYGWVHTSHGPSPVAEAVGSGLRHWSAFFSVVSTDSKLTRMLGLPASSDAMKDQHWEAAFKRASMFDDEPLALASFYSLAVQCGRPAPAMLRHRRRGAWADAPCGEVNVTADTGDAHAIEQDGLGVLLAPTPDDVSRLVARWGLRSAPHREMNWRPLSEPEEALDRFPRLRAIEGIDDELCLQSCEEIWLESRNSTEGMSRHVIESALRDRCLYYTGPRDDRWVLLELLKHIRVSLPIDRTEAILSDVQDRNVEERLRQVQDCASFEEKLLLCVGIEELLAGIPNQHLRRQQINQESFPSEIARLAQAVFGIEVLKAYQPALSKKGFRPPKQWAGSADTIVFVSKLGFPVEYAGFPGRLREPWQDVRGPVKLPPLHDFQEKVTSEIAVFLMSRPARRGLLSLPTGAGKTRVCIEALIRWLKSMASGGQVLWIAQNDELCEQSVQTWLLAWQAIGPTAAPLRVNRLWGDTNDRVRRAEAGYGVTVASYQSLVRRVDDHRLEWVFDPAAVVIDEAHGATAHSYTQILARLGLKHGMTSRPLIGLTATPFRGCWDEQETARLAARFDFERFDLHLAAASDLYKTLQKEGILAEIDTVAALKGETLELDRRELQSLQEYRVVPASAEKRLGASPTRSRRILDHITALPAEWPVLVFATSVEHAEELAVDLNMAGIAGCAITGTTNAGVRKHAIEAFKAGRIRVLTNYGVLTTGFDAPAIRALYITRPVFSPVLYQQMIGRGLRGSKNGGKERCLIVNVEDNIFQYGERLAFHAFEHLWHKT